MRTAFTQGQVKELDGKLTLVMENERPYLNPRISSPDLAERLGACKV